MLYIDALHVLSVPDPNAALQSAAVLPGTHRSPANSYARPGSCLHGHGGGCSKRIWSLGFGK